MKSASLGLSGQTEFTFNTEGLGLSFSVPVLRVSLVRESTAETPEQPVGSPRDIFNLLRPRMADMDRETVVAVLLNTKNRVVAINTVAVGDLDSCIVHPREVFKPAILAGVASVIVAHNHPSGDPTPSKEDANITRRLHEAGEIIGITLLDHIVIGSSSFVSLKEKGLF